MLFRLLRRPIPAADVSQPCLMIGFVHLKSSYAHKRYWHPVRRVNILNLPPRSGTRGLEMM
jgi:hypothetical protein